MAAGSPQLRIPSGATPPLVARLADLADTAGFAKAARSSAQRPPAPRQPVAAPASSLSVRAQDGPEPYSALGLICFIEIVVRATSAMPW